MEKIGHLLLVFGRAVGKAHAHAAEPDGRNFQIAFPQFALLGCLSFESLSVLMLFERDLLSGFIHGLALLANTTLDSRPG
jgi:hypothetical protein